LVRTVKEEPCQFCGRITNYYDQLIGRICPECLADWTANMLRNRLDLLGLPIPSYDDLLKCNEDLLNLPLVDHSRDIDAHVSESKR